MTDLLFHRLRRTKEKTNKQTNKQTKSKQQQKRLLVMRMSDLFKISFRRFK